MRRLESNGRQTAPIFIYWTFQWINSGTIFLRIMFLIQHMHPDFCSDVGFINRFGNAFSKPWTTGLDDFARPDTERAAAIDRRMRNYLLQLIVYARRNAGRFNGAFTEFGIFFEQLNMISLLSNVNKVMVYNDSALSCANRVGGLFGYYFFIRFFIDIIFFWNFLYVFLT